MDKQWAYDTWATADFGDLRLSARAVEIGAAAMSSYEKSIPDRCETWAATKATYRFLDNARVSHGALQQAHWTFVMQEALAHEGPVLWVQDGSEVLFNSRRFLAGCGPTCDSLGNGMLLHSCLALKWHGSLGSVIGLGFQSIWTRGEQTMLPRDGSAKESAVWRETLEALGQVPEDSTWISVCDRGCDCFEFFAAAQSLGWDYVVRARHNRKVGTGKSSQEGLLHYARALDSIGSRTVQMRSREDHPGKEINLQYAAAPVTLPVPDGVLGSPIALYVVRIWGDDVEWILLTSQPAETLEQLQLIGDFYQHRWVIEEYHKSLKSGLNVEGSQLRTAPRIANLVGFLGVIASLLLVLRDQARSNPDLPASEFVSETVISLVRRARPKVPPNPSIRDLVRAIASMGGFLCRKGDGEPGWITLWRGWNRIRHYLELAA